jgi:hypothetical protein
MLNKLYELHEELKGTEKYNVLKAGQDKDFWERFITSIELILYHYQVDQTVCESEIKKLKLAFTLARLNNGGSLFLLTNPFCARLANLEAYLAGCPSPNQLVGALTTLYKDYHNAKLGFLAGMELRRVAFKSFNDSQRLTSPAKLDASMPTPLFLVSKDIIVIIALFFDLRTIGRLSRVSFKCSKLFEDRQIWLNVLKRRLVTDKQFQSIFFSKYSGGEAAINNVDSAELKIKFKTIIKLQKEQNLPESRPTVQAYISSERERYLKLTKTPAGFGSHRLDRAGWRKR